jgi:hypothetical protein
VNITLLTQGSSAANIVTGANYPTAVVNPTAGAYIVLACAIGATIADPTIAGVATTWSKIRGVGWNTGAAPTDGLWFYKGVGPFTSGQITITVADSATNAEWYVFEVTDYHATTPIPQSASHTRDAGNTTQPALATFAHASNYTMLLAAADSSAAQTLTFEASYVQLGTDIVGEARRVVLGYLAGNDTTPTATYSSSVRDLASLAMELAVADAGGGGGVANPWYAFANG